MLQVVEAIISCGKGNSSEIARSLSKIRGGNFKTNDMFLYRLLGNKKFQLNDKFWRCYVNVIFDLLSEQKHINKQDKIVISIDFTSDTDDFLILSASLVIKEVAIPIYFSMRLYPKRKNQMNQKKMEEAFIKALAHILSDKYEYILLADRGFGNSRFISYCEENGFEYMIRLEPNMRIKNGCGEGIARNIIKEDGVFKSKILSWKKEYNIIRTSNKEQSWYIATNVDEKSISSNNLYEKRFKIEKLFQNLKSGGFDIESSKVKKYDRFKRLLFLVSYAYSIMAITGLFINNHVPKLKKNSPISTSLLIASLSLHIKPLGIIKP